MQFELGSIVAASVIAMMAFAGCIVWNIRLEGRVNYCEKTIVAQDKQVVELWSRINAFDDKIVEKLSQIEKSLARLEGRMQIENERHT